MENGMIPKGLELLTNNKIINMARKSYSEYGKDWMYFYWGKRFDISYEVCGYFDATHRINIALCFFSWTIVLPIWSKYTDECCPPKWGIGYHDHTLWIYRGGKGNMKGGTKWWTFSMPWKYDWFRTSNLRKDGKWEHETEGNSKNFYEDKWKEVIWNETYPYVYVLKSKTVQNRLATIKVEEREWRPLWFKWTPIFKKVVRSISVDFNDEVGERTGSWKGGTTGCGYNMIGPELPFQTLKRMEQERKF